MRRSYIIAFLIGLFAAGWILSGYLDPGKTPPSAVASDTAVVEAAKPMEVRVRRVSSAPHPRRIIANGRTAASRSVGLRAETEGRIVAVLADEGAAVKKGQMIARIDMKWRKEKLAEAQSLLHQREIEYEAARQLREKGFRAKTTFAQSAALLEAARAEVETVKSDISHTEIRAPFDGVLDKRAVELGDFLKIGDGVATLVDLDPILIVAYVSEREIGAVARGQKASVRLVDGRAAEARVSYISSVADPQTRTYRVEAEVANADRQIPDGMTAELKIPLAPLPAVELSPAVLSLSDDGILGIKSVADGGKVVFVPVQIVDNTPSGTWVSGIPDGTVVITVGHEFVKHGGRVVPVFETGPAS